ncbi:MAG: type II toxin-antitoxin system Phd/YefM family antitoxin [Thermoleophilaceae bacterium]
MGESAGGEKIKVNKHGRTVSQVPPAAGAQSLKGSLQDVAMTAVGEDELFSTDASWNAS